MNISTHSHRLAFPQRIRADWSHLPAAFVENDALLGADMLYVPRVGLWHFGVMVSSVHWLWARTVGRMEDGWLVYEPGVIYNNFVWPEADASSERIETAARGILSARAAHPGMPLGTLCTPSSTPPDVQAAHAENDAAVLAAYGLPPDATETAVLFLLFAYNSALSELD